MHVEACPLSQSPCAVAQFRLSVRSDVMRVWSVEEVTYTGYYCHVMVTVHGCGFKATLSKSKNSHNHVTMVLEPMLHSS